MPANAVVRQPERGQRLMRGRGSSSLLSQAKRILVPTDFSEGADRALEMAIDLAKVVGATIEIVNVCDTTSYVMALPPQAFTPTAAEQPSVDQALAERERKARDAGVSCRTRALNGNPRYEIVDLAEREKTDAIVMGTHGRTGLKHVLVGSVAERVVQHAGCPVIVVPSRR